MKVLAIRQEPGIFFKAMLIAFSLFYFGVSLCAYKSNLEKTPTYKGQDIEVLALHHTPVYRLMLCPLSASYSSDIEVMPFSLSVLRTKVLQANATITANYASNVFCSLPTINAP